MDKETMADILYKSGVEGGFYMGDNRHGGSNDICLDGDFDLEKMCTLIDEFYVMQLLAAS